MDASRALFRQIANDVMFDPLVARVESHEGPWSRRRSLPSPPEPGMDADITAPPSTPTRRNGHTGALLPSTTAFTLRTLGTIGLSDAQGRPVLTRGKQLALLVYLSAAPRRSASRALLVDLLWSESDEVKGRHSLRNALSDIRRELHADSLTTSGDNVTLSARVACDRDAFLAAIGKPDHLAAVASYTGEFLPNFALPECGEFERWADLERRKLRTAYLRCSEAEVRRALDEARWRDAQRIARNARDADATNERTWRLLLESLLSGGDTVEAAMEAMRLQEAWRNDEQEPDADTVRLVATALGPNSPVVATSSLEDTSAQRLVPDMVGRATQFSALLHAWEQVGKPRGVHLHVTASAGFGKTRLLAEFRRRLRTTRTRVVVVSASISDRDLSYSLASELAVALSALRGASGISSDSAATLVALNPSLAASFDVRPDTATGEEALRRRALALEELLAAVSEERPLALLLDDVHWADAASERMLLRLVRRARSLPCMLVTASRPGSVLTLDADQASIIELGPLSALEAAELVTSLGALPDEPWIGGFAEDLLAASHGTPLVVLETLAHLCDIGALRLCDRVWQCDDPHRVRAVLAKGEGLRLRASSLAPLDAAMMLALAALGGPGETHLLSSVVGCDQDAANSALARLERSGFVRRVAAEQWTCAHDEIAAAVLTEGKRTAGSFGPSPLTALHSRIAEALLRDDDNLISLRRAGVHSLAAGDELLLGRAVRRWSLVRGAQGDRRSPREQVLEFLAASTDDEAQIARIARLLPRTRPTTYAAYAGIVLAGFAILLGAQYGRPSAPVAAAAVTLVAVTPEHESYTVRVSLLDAATTHADTPLISAAEAEGLLLPRPGHPGTFAYGMVSQDTGETDIYLSDNGKSRRLTVGKGDDNVTDWSPDGRYLLFSTSRWDREWFSDIARYDLATGEVIPLVRSLHISEGSARWSPDGTRIVFVRSRMKTRQPEELCLMHSDGQSVQCHALPGNESIDIAGWKGLNHALVNGDSSGVRRLLDVDVTTMRTQVIDTRVGQIYLSPDGSWELCHCVQKTANGDVWQIARVGDVEGARTIAAPEGLQPIALLWSGAQMHSLRTIRISAPAHAISLSEPYSLQVRGSDSADVPVELHALRWSTSDTSIASIDSGVLHPRRPGTIIVRATAGGWASDSISLDVAGSSARSEWSATWEPGSAAWKQVRLYGSPRPLPLLTDRGWSFWNHGDGSFSSGAYSIAAWSPLDGLSLRTSIQLPRSQAVWQNITIGFASGLKGVRLEKWDHRTAYLPEERLAGHCLLNIPASEGVSSYGWGLLSSSTDHAKFAVSENLQHGKWVTVKLDALPDGRCSVTLDGVHVATVRGNRNSAPMRFVTYGQSVNTQALVRRVEVWTGVPDSAGTAIP